MGADGSMVVARRDDFEEANPGVPPSWLHLYTGKVLGIEAVWGYWGDNLYGSNYVTPWKHDNYPVDDERCYDDGVSRDYTPEERQRLVKAVQWFEANAETHEVWT